MNLSVKKWVTAAALLTGMAAAQAGFVNPYAAGLPAASYTGSGAFQSSMYQAFFNNGYWNAGAHGTYWLQADMGVSHTLSEVKFRSDQLPEGNVSYRAYISENAIGGNYGALTPVASYAGFSNDDTIYDFHFAPTTGRYLEIVANGGPSWTALDTSSFANFVETAQQGGVTDTGTVPEPGSLALVAFALVSIQVARRKNKSKNIA